MNKLLVEQIKSESSLTKFFYDLLYTKQPKWDEVSDIERLSYLIKYYSGYCFFALGNQYHSFISWITQYYPFSLLYRDRLFHHDNLKIRNLMIEFENIAKKEGINILVLSGGIEGNMAELVGYLDQKTKNRQKNLSNLETALQKVYETIYVRDQGDEFRIIIPTESFEKIIVNE